MQQLRQIINLLAPFKIVVKTITTDNGKGFTIHQSVAQELNDRPKKSLQYKTPSEVFLTNFKSSVALIG